VLRVWLVRSLPPRSRRVDLMTEPRTWVCDGCMRRVLAADIAEFADFEHVLCRRCVHPNPPAEVSS
jgi:hypothetical protein